MYYNDDNDIDQASNKNCDLERVRDWCESDREVFMKNTCELLKEIKQNQPGATVMVRVTILYSNLGGTAD